MSAYADAPPPVIVRGEGARICDDRGKSYLDPGRRFEVRDQVRLLVRIVPEKGTSPRG